MSEESKGLLDHHTCPPATSEPAPSPLGAGSFSWRDHKDRLTELWASGHSASLIAQIMGITRNAVMGAVGRFQLPKRPTLIGTTPTAHKQAKNKEPAPKPVYKQRAPWAVPKPQKPLKAKIKKTRKCNPIDIMALNRNTCRWMVTETLYCGMPTAGESFCPEHKAIVYLRRDK